jgi:hypothetical protein
MAASTTFTDEQLGVAGNRAAADIRAAIGAGEEGERDLVNLVVNTTAHYLHHPDSTLTQAIEAFYSEPPAKVLAWTQA